LTGIRRRIHIKQTNRTNQINVVVDVNVVVVVVVVAVISLLFVMLLITLKETGTAASSGTRRVAGLGAEGKAPQNTERDFFRFVRLPLDRAL
jgi:hypothetical protein